MVQRDRHRTRESSLKRLAWWLAFAAACAGPKRHEPSGHAQPAVEVRPAVAAQPSVGAAPPVELVLRAALPIESAEEGFQPSGLLLDGRQLLVVSDKHDRAIYRLELGPDAATAVPFVVFDPPPDEAGALDYEGLSAAEAGGWLVTSESRSRVLEVGLATGPDANGGAARPLQGQARWHTPSLGDAGRAAGCLVVPNAGLEGITLLPGGGLLLAVEREPRALIELRAPTEAPVIWLMQHSEYAPGKGRNLDFSDLTRSGEQVYALARHVHLLVRLTHTSGAWREGAAFSYRATENDPRFRYEDRTYGLAEGVALGASEVFVIMDNNGQAREADRRDRRAQLFVFERPAGL